MTVKYIPIVWSNTLLGASDVQNAEATLRETLRCSFPIRYVASCGQDNLFLVDGRDAVTVAVTQHRTHGDVTWLDRAYETFGKDAWSDEFIFECARIGLKRCVACRAACDKACRGCFRGVCVDCRAKNGACPTCFSACGWNGCKNPAAFGPMLTYRCGHVRGACAKCTDKLSHPLKACCRSCCRKCQHPLCKAFAPRVASLATKQKRKRQHNE